MFWTRVDIEQSTEQQTATGNPRLVWAPHLADLEARVLPLVVDETREDWGTPQEDAYEVQLRGRHDVRPRMRVSAGGQHYDIRKVMQPPPFGEPSTVLLTVLVTP